MSDSVVQSWDGPVLQIDTNGIRVIKQINIKFYDWGLILLQWKVDQW